MRWSFLFVLAVTLLACSENPDPYKLDSKRRAIDNESNEKAGKQKGDESDIEKQLKKQFETLYGELLGFKDAEDFAKYGFGMGSPYLEWLESIQMHEKDSLAGLLAQEGYDFKELKRLGLEYASSYGKETESTKAIRNNIVEIESAWSIQNQEVSSEPRQTRSLNEKGDSWYAGGTLHGSEIGEWKNSSEKNKLATCADFVATTNKNLSLKELKIQARALMHCIDKATAGVTETNDMKVSKVAAQCATLIEN